MLSTLRRQTFVNRGAHESNLGGRLIGRQQVRLVANDRSIEYARGTTLGAPTAVRVAGR